MAGIKTSKSRADSFADVLDPPPTLTAGSELARRLWGKALFDAAHRPSPLLNVLREKGKRR